MQSFDDMKSASSIKILRDDSSSLRFKDVNERLQDFKSAVAETIESNLNLLQEIPLHGKFRMEELKEFFRCKIKDTLQNDPIFEKGIEIAGYAKDMFEYMRRYFEEIFDFHDELRKEEQSKIFGISRVFLNSDLSPEFVRTIVDSILAEMDYIDIFDRRIRKEKLSLIANRNNRVKFERICELHNRWVKEFEEKFRRNRRERLKLIWYVDLNNSASMEEIFEDKEIKMSRLDRVNLQSFLNCLQKQIDELAKQNLSAEESRSFFSYAPDEATKALGKMVLVLSRHEGTK